jgi:hypothetical protein
MVVRLKRLKIFFILLIYFFIVKKNMIMTHCGARDNILVERLKQVGQLVFLFFSNSNTIKKGLFFFV